MCVFVGSWSRLKGYAGLESTVWNLLASSHNAVYVRKVDREIMTFCQYLQSEQREKHKSAADLFARP